MALSAGIDQAQGGIIILMDSDLQNDPHDIPLLLEKLNEGYDVVSGWRKDRKDRFLTRKVPSWIANSLLSKLSGVKIHDFGCTLKAYRREIISKIELYGETHRLIPIYTQMFGAKTAEIVVNHRPRIHGHSKYNLWRVFKVILDVIITHFLAVFATRPIYIFGGIGLCALTISILGGFFVSTRYFFFGGVWMSPLLLISLMFFALGIQLLLLGIIAELLVRIYFKSRDEKPYYVSEVYKSNSTDPSPY